jgi:hypothetical protein
MRLLSKAVPHPSNTARKTRPVVPMQQAAAALFGLIRKPPPVTVTSPGPPRARPMAAAMTFVALVSSIFLPPDQFGPGYLHPPC